MSFCKYSTFSRSTLVAVVALALVFSQTLPALAYGPNGSFAGYNDVRAMVDFRVPLGASQSDRDRSPSFGFTVKRQFQFNDPLYETMSGSYRNSTNLTVDMMDLRFGMNGKISGFDVGGFNAFKSETLLNAADNGEDGSSTTQWLLYGGLVVVLVGIVVLATQAGGGESAAYL